jgi:Leucine-rich repeat (LRR) protein
LTCYIKKKIKNLKNYFNIFSNKIKYYPYYYLKYTPTLNIAILIIKRKVDPITNKHGGFVLTCLLSRPRAALSLQTNKRIKRKKKNDGEGLAQNT